VRTIETERRGKVQVTLIAADEAKQKSLRLERARYCSLSLSDPLSDMHTEAHTEAHAHKHIRIRPAIGVAYRGTRTHASGSVTHDIFIVVLASSACVRTPACLSNSLTLTPSLCVFLSVGVSHPRLENPLSLYPVEAYLEGQRFPDRPRVVFPYQLCVCLLPLIDLCAVRACVGCVCMYVCLSVCVYVPAYSVCVHE
jgi:hypothetical protein